MSSCGSMAGADQMRQYTERYDALKAELQSLGFLFQGSLQNSGGSGTRNPEEVEHRFRRKWNSESGKWNTESGGSGTSIPEEVEQRFRRS